MLTSFDWYLAFFEWDPLSSFELLCDIGNNDDCDLVNLLMICELI